MLKFFRRIRQKLVGEGNLNRYLLYSIGEILLVMIGILLALQVNNWNEERKLRKQEISSLENLRSDLVKTASSLERCNKIDSSLVEEINNILDHIKNNRPYHDSLSLQFENLYQWAKPRILNSAYENLKFSKGLELISNDSLRQEIIKIHETDYPFLLTDIDKEETMIHQELMLPLFGQLFETNENGGAIPNDYSSLQKNQEFVNVLTLTRRYRLASIFFEKTTKERTHRLIDKLELELVRLKK